jgi:hypothetical protein
MRADDLGERLSQIAAILLGRNGDQLGASTGLWLTRRLDRRDWLIPNDVEDVRQLLPRCLRSALD